MFSLNVEQAIMFSFWDKKVLTLPAVLSNLWIFSNLYQITFIDTLQQRNLDFGSVVSI